MSKITIVHSEKFARGKISQSLADQGLDGDCTVASDADGASGAVLWVGSAPKDIKESDHFDAPLRLGALMERAKRHVRLLQEGAETLEIGPFQLDVHNNILSDDGEDIRLTDKETDILCTLAKAGGELVERQNLLDEVWGYAENVETHTLETHIYRLRQKIEQDPANPKILLTAEQGYRLN